MKNNEITIPPPASMFFIIFAEFRNIEGSILPKPAIEVYYLIYSSDILTNMLLAYFIISG